MKYSLMFVISLLSSTVFAGKPNEGAEYVGRDSVKNGYCIVEIKKIEKSFLADKITAQIAIQGLPPREITFGEYDIANNAYARYFYDIDAQEYSGYTGKKIDYLVDEYFRLKVSKDKSVAELEWHVMESDVKMPKCKMKLKQPEPAAVTEVSIEASDSDSSAQEEPSTAAEPTADQDNE